MVEIVWTEPAEADLREIFDYIARDSSEYATLTTQRIVAAAGRLREFPLSGRKLPELVRSPYREVLVGNYRVVYRYPTTKGDVLVVAVIHAGRLLPPVLRDRE